MKKVQYCVWEEETGEDAGYWMLFDSIEDAVSHSGDGTDVYRMEAKFLGRYKRAVQTLRVKVRKSKKKPAKRKAA